MNKQPYLDFLRLEMWLLLQIFSISHLIDQELLCFENCAVNVPSLLTLVETGEYDLISVSLTQMQTFFPAVSASNYLINTFITNLLLCLQSQPFKLNNEALCDNTEDEEPEHMHFFMVK